MDQANQHILLTDAGGGIGRLPATGLLARGAARATGPNVGFTFKPFRQTWVRRTA